MEEKNHTNAFSELHLDPDKEILEESSNFEITDFQPAEYYKPKATVPVRQLPKNYDKDRKRRRQLQKKARKINRKKK